MFIVKRLPEAIVIQVQTLYSFFSEKQNHISKNAFYACGTDKMCDFVLRESPGIPYIIIRNLFKQIAQIILIIIYQLRSSYMFRPLQGHQHGGIYKDIEVQQILTLHTHIVYRISYTCMPFYLVEVETRSKNKSDKWLFITHCVDCWVKYCTITPLHGICITFNTIEIFS
jgi:hypothetical protein